ncbi:MAG: DUF5119 domain-containing protein [Bacteroidales bacterium]|nr:DUF5119 domain-containing protein [Bacteroidales bacterium]
MRKETMKTTTGTALPTGRGSRRIAASLLLLALLLAGGCRREPLVQQAQNVELRVSVDLEINTQAMWVKPQTPGLYRVLFFDPDTRQCVSEMFCGPNGGQVRGVKMGQAYDVVVYNDDAEYTRVTGDRNVGTITAYTEEMADDGRAADSRTDDSRLTVIRQPDHLLVARDSLVKIPLLTDRDTTIVINTFAKTILDSYYIEVDSLVGLANASSACIYLTGQCGSNLIAYDLRGTEEYALRIPCTVDAAGRRLYATFNTFGKLPGVEGLARVHIVVSGDGGRDYDFVRDITPQYERDDHRLILSVGDTISAPSQGGFSPTVDDWGEEEWDFDVY